VFSRINFASVDFEYADQAVLAALARKPAMRNFDEFSPGDWLEMV